MKKLSDAEIYRLFKPELSPKKMLELGVFGGSYFENNIKEYIRKNAMYRNPFYLGWNKGWSFLFFLEGGIAKIEAKGFGISITTKVEKGESPLESADRLVSKEQRIRKSRYYSWVKSINEKTIN